jgi:predicted Zn-dependent protease
LVIHLLIFLACLGLPFARAQAPDPAAEAERARQLVASGHTEEAVPIYQRLVDAHPSNADLLLNLSIAEFSAGLYRPAANHAQAALNLKPDLSAANLFLGASYLKLGEPAAALKPLRIATEAAPADLNARLLLAECLLGSKELDEALAGYRALAEAAPGNARVWFGLGQTYDALAEASANELQTAAPDSSYWLVLQGDFLARQRRFGSAFATYREALVHGRLIPGIHAGLANVYRKTGHAQWADEEDAAEGKLHSSDAAKQGPSTLYVSYRSNRDLAAQAYGRLSQFPDAMESHLHLATTLDSEGLHREAAEHWRKALERSPRDPSLRLGLAQALYDTRDYQGVLDVLSTTLKQDPDSPSANFLYGASLVGLETPGRAIPYLEVSLRSPSHVLPAKAALGQAYLLLGKPEEAIPFLKAVIPTAKDGASRFQLFRAYQLTGKTELARQALADYRSFQKSFEEQRGVEDGSQISAPEIK